MKTAIICAMERESDALLGYAQNVRAEKRSGVEIYTGTISGKEVAVCRSGVGKAFAAAATAVLIERFSPEAIISSGVAGGDASLKPGTVFIASRSVEHDYFVPDEQVRYFPSDQTLLYRAQEACLSEKCEFFAGTIASGDCFVTGEQKNSGAQKQIFGARIRYGMCRHHENLRRRGRKKRLHTRHIRQRQRRRYEKLL